MNTLDAAFERNKRCTDCHFEPCVCAPRMPRGPVGEPQTLRHAIEKALCSDSPLKALAVEMEVAQYLRRQIEKKAANAAQRKDGMELLDRLLGLK